MKRLKVSRGEFKVSDQRSGKTVGTFQVRNTNDSWNIVCEVAPYEFREVSPNQARANAELFCDAINTANKLDKLPSELAADREMLLNAVKAVAAGMDAGEDRETLEQIINKVEG